MSQPVILFSMNYSLYSPQRHSISFDLGIGILNFTFQQKETIKLHIITYLHYLYELLAYVLDIESISFFLPNFYMK